MTIKIKEKDWSKIKITKIKVFPFSMRLDEDIKGTLDFLSKKEKVNFADSFDFILRIGLDAAIKEGEKFSVSLGIERPDKKRITTSIKEDMLYQTSKIAELSKISKGHAANLLLRKGIETILEELKSKGGKDS